MGDEGTAAQRGELQVVRGSWAPKSLTKPEERAANICIDGHLEQIVGKVLPLCLLKKGNDGSRGRLVSANSILDFFPWSEVITTRWKPRVTI